MTGRRGNDCQLLSQPHGFESFGPVGVVVDANDRPVSDGPHLCRVQFDRYPASSSGHALPPERDHPVSGVQDLIDARLVAVPARQPFVKETADRLSASGRPCSLATSRSGWCPSRCRHARNVDPAFDSGRLRLPPAGATRLADGDRPRHERGDERMQGMVARPAGPSCVPTKFLSKPPPQRRDGLAAVRPRLPPLVALVARPPGAQRGGRVDLGNAPRRSGAVDLDPALVLQPVEEPQAALACALRLTSVTSRGRREGAPVNPALQRGKQMRGGLAQA
jgi:hypothetical protein